MEFLLAVLLQNISEPRMAANLVTEEAFVYATLREFVKLWDNGSQAYLQVQCHEGQAWIHLMSALRPPSSPHLFRQDDHHGYHGPRHHHGYHDPHHPHGYHGPHPRQQERRRRKGPKQRDRDRARAALHRASLLEAAAAAQSTPTAPVTIHHTQQLLPPSPSAQPVCPAAASPSPPAAPATIHHIQQVLPPSPVQNYQEPEHHQPQHRSRARKHPPRARRVAEFPAATPLLQVSPVWPSHYQEDVDSILQNHERSPMLYMWQSPKPHRTKRGSVCPPETPPAAHQSLSDSSLPPRSQTESLHQVIQALNERDAQPSPSRATPCRQRQYRRFGADFCYQLTSEGSISMELTSKSKKLLARRGGHWKVVGSTSDEESDEFDDDDESEEDDVSQ